MVIDFGVYNCCVRWEGRIRTTGGHSFGCEFHWFKGGNREQARVEVGSIMSLGSLNWKSELDSREALTDVLKAFGSNCS